MPTIAPTTTEPTVAPTTSEPTVSPAPTPLQSASPTGDPSSSPSDVPSLTPSLAPSHSIWPSFSPSQLPTFFPTASQAPTFDEIDSSNRFRLKMHWADGFFWQEEDRERFYCASCMRCYNLTFTEFPEDLNCTDSFECTHGDQLWLRKCKMEKGVFFKTVHVELGMMLGLAGKGTCVNRVRRDFVDVEKCNSSAPTQMWRPVSLEQPFELRPAYENANEKGYDYCISQHHHPKDTEILGMKKCYNARGDNTSLWGTYQPKIFAPGGPAKANSGNSTNNGNARE